VLERADGLISSFDELLAESRSSASEVAGVIRFTAPASFGAARLTPVLAEFMAAHPKVRIELLLTDTPLDLIEEGIDLGLRVARTLPPSLIARRIGDAAVGVYGAPAYLRSHGTPKHPDELRAHECLVYSSASRDAIWEFSHPVTQQSIEVRPRGLLYANNAEALLAAAVHGSGLAMLPHMLAAAAVARGELVSVLSHWESPALGIWLVYGSRRNQPLRVRKLIEHLSRALATDDDSAPQPAAPRPSAALRL
jgi:DNA-binding transcriptional LysR family regulator